MKRRFPVTCALLLVSSLALAAACGRYGAPIRPEPAPPAPASPPEGESEGETPEDVPRGEPDFRLNLPDIGTEEEE